MQHKPIVCYRYVISYHTVLLLLVNFNKDLEGELHESEIKRGWRSRPFSCLSRAI
jgi:hypothetical protein